MVHIFDYPAEFSDDPVKQVFSGFGEVRNVKRQKFIGRPDIETGTRLVLMAFRVIPPRLVSIDGYLVQGATDHLQLVQRPRSQIRRLSQ